MEPRKVPSSTEKGKDRKSSKQEGGDRFGRDKKRKAKRKKQDRKDGFSIDRIKAASAVFPAGDGAPAGKTADAAFLRSMLNPSFLACFFSFCFPFFVSSKPVTSLFLRTLPIFSLLCTSLKVCQVPPLASFLYFYLFIPAVLSLDLTKPYGETLSSQ